MIKEKEKRDFYEKECINSKWAVRELKRQIESSLYERLLLSDGKANKEKVLKLAKEGQAIERPKDILKDPYVFEFLGIPENKPVLEKDLEYKLIKHIEDFLLELGKGFMFVGSQQRVTVLCAEKDEIVAEYSLEGLNNNIFASKYTYCIPDKEQLIKEVEKVLRENEE